MSHQRKTRRDRRKARQSNWQRLPRNPKVAGHGSSLSVQHELHSDVPEWKRLQNGHHEQAEQSRTRLQRSSRTLRHRPFEEGLTSLQQKIIESQPVGRLTDGDLAKRMRAKRGGF